MLFVLALPHIESTFIYYYITAQAMQPTDIID